ncbi:MAG: response regulator [Deltaproteobacteria bacterium]|nr:response regulator [Deltaproteobacteria bacterium]
MSFQKRLTLLKTNAVISVVDDDASVRNSLRRLLTSMGFEVRIFPSALEFLHKGPLHDYGCVIVDVRMPEINGLDLQKRLADSGVPLPIIFITAYEDPGVRAQAMQAGALAFFQKPFNEASLTDAICLALERSRQQTVGSSETVGKNVQAYLQISDIKKQRR